MHSWLVFISVVVTLWFLDYVFDEAVAAEGDGVIIAHGLPKIDLLYKKKKNDRQIQ